MDQAYLAEFFGAAVARDGWAMLNHLKRYVCVCVCVRACVCVCVYYVNMYIMNMYICIYTYIYVLYRSFVQNLESVTWMDNATHTTALRKAQNMRLHLGGPTEYKMMPYDVSNTSYFNNSARAYHVKMLRLFVNLGLPLPEVSFLTLISSLLTLIRSRLTPIRSILTLLRSLLTRIRSRLTLIRSRLTLIRSILTLLRSLLTLISSLLTLIRSRLTLIRSRFTLLRSRLTLLGLF